MSKIILSLFLFYILVSVDSQELLGGAQQSFHTGELIVEPSAANIVEGATYSAALDRAPFTAG